MNKHVYMRKSLLDTRASIPGCWFVGHVEYFNYNIANIAVGVDTQIDKMCQIKKMGI